MTIDPQIYSRLLDPLPATLWALGGALAAHLWRKFQERMVTLRWQAAHQPLAVSAQDALFGKIEVRYNGNEVNNLFFTTIDIQNESNSDLTDVDVNCVFNDGTHIFVSHGAVVGSANSLPFADPFKAEFDRFLMLPSGDSNAGMLIDRLQVRRDYRVPVLNRFSSVKIGMIVQAPPGRTPNVIVASDHPGLRLAFQKPRNLLFGVDRDIAAFVGLVTGTSLVIAICVAPIDAWSKAMLAFVVGCLSGAIGALVVRAFRRVTRLLS